MMVKFGVKFVSLHTIACNYVNTFHSNFLAYVLLGNKYGLILLITKAKVVDNKSKTTLLVHTLKLYYLKRHISIHLSLL